MLQELSENLRKSIQIGIFSPLKDYLQFEFEQKTIIFEYSSLLWFSSKLLLVSQLSFGKENALFSLKDSPNFPLFLKQVQSFKVEISEDQMIISSIIPLHKTPSFSKHTFRENLQNWVSNNPQELRDIINNSIPPFYLHYSNISKQPNMIKEKGIIKALDNDTTLIFMEKGNLFVHSTDKIPSQKIEQKVYTNLLNSPLVELQKMDQDIFNQLQARDGYCLEEIVNTIPSHMYFTYYNQKFLIVQYITLWRLFIEELEGFGNQNRTERIDLTVQIKSALFSINEQTQIHTLVHDLEDNENAYPQISSLFSKQLCDIMEPNQFMELFTENIHHPNVNLHSDIQILSKQFQPGSVLIHESFFTNKACVYLGCNLIISVVLNESEVEERINENLADELRARQDQEIQDSILKIFKFQQIEQFNDTDTPIDITEIRFAFQPYDKQELHDKAILMNDLPYEFNVYKQNSEHLAFQLASGFKYSPQQSRLINKIGAAIFDILEK